MSKAEKELQQIQNEEQEAMSLYERWIYDSIDFMEEDEFNEMIEEYEKTKENGQYDNVSRDSAEDK